MNNFSDEFFAYLEIEQYKELERRFPEIRSLDFVLLNTDLSIECDQLIQAETLIDIAPELLETAYFLTGRTELSIYFESKRIHHGDYRLQLNPVVEPPLIMPTATLEQTAPPQIDLPMADIQVQRVETLIPIEQVVSQLSARTHQTPEAIRANIDRFVPTRYKLGETECITSKALVPVVQRWAEAIASEVAMAVQAGEMLQPVESVPARKSATKKTAPAAKKKTGTAARKPAAKTTPKVSPSPDAAD